MVGNEIHPVCRLCLSENGSLIYIFESKRIQGWTAADGIVELLRMQVSADDIYPQCVCVECMEKLEDFKLFKQRCEINKELLDRAYTGKGGGEECLDSTLYNRDNPNGCSYPRDDVQLEKDPLDVTEEEMRINLKKEGGNVSNELDTGEVVDSSGSVFILVNKEDGKPTTTLDKFNSKNLSASSNYRTTLSNPSIPFLKKDGDGTAEQDVGSSSESHANPEAILKESFGDDSNDTKPTLPGVESDTEGDSNGSTARERLGPEDVIMNMETLVEEGDSELEEGEESLDNAMGTGYSESGRSFSPESNLDEEEMVPFGEMSFQCATCNEMFQSREILQVHDCALAPRGFKCHLCGRNFAQANRLKMHMGVHLGEKPHVCKICNKAFAQQGSLKRHEMVHTGNKPWVCATCGKSFLRKGQLTVHEMSHDGDLKPYKCKVCNKGFAQNSHLTQHMTVHTGERRFTCIICQKSFTQSGHLRQHLRIHSGEKPYKCDQCDKQFAQKNHLKYHEYMHSGERPFRCEDCDKGFHYRGDLKKHRWKHHKEKPSEDLD